MAPVSGVDVSAQTTSGRRYWTRRRLLVKQLLIEGVSERAIAERIGTDRSYIQQTKRHPIFRAALDAYYAELNADLMTYQYGNKVNRVAELNDTAQRLAERKREAGITTTQTRYDAKGNLLEEREVVDKDLLTEGRATLHAIAEELGQLRDVDNAGTTVLIREINIQVGGLL